MTQELESVELYKTFRVIQVAPKIRCIEYSPLLAGVSIYKNHAYRNVKDFFGEESAEECFVYCLELAKKTS